MNGGDLFIELFSPGFHISGVCSDIRIWMLLTRFDRDVIWFCFFTVSPSAVYNGVTVIESSPRLRSEQINGLRRITLALTSSSDSFPLSVRLSDVALVNRSMMRTQGCSFHFSNRGTTFLWLNAHCDDVTGRVLSPKYAKTCTNYENLQDLKKLRSLLWFCHKFRNCRIAKSWRDCLIQLSAL